MGEIEIRVVDMYIPVSMSSRIPAAAGAYCPRKTGPAAEATRRSPMRGLSTNPSLGGKCPVHSGELKAVGGAG